MHALPPLYDQAHNYSRFFTEIAVGGFISTAILIQFGSIIKIHKFLCKIFIALFILCPPIWFFYEYYYYFPNYGNPQITLTQLSEAQGVTSKVWVAMSVVLGAFYNNKFKVDNV